jgi:hypothetical protein
LDNKIAIQIALIGWMIIVLEHSSRGKSII